MNAPSAARKSLKTLFLQAPSFDGFDKGMRLAAISYPHLSKEEMFHSMAIYYRRFYVRPGKIWAIVGEMLGSWDMMKRRLREGVGFFRFLRAHAA